MKTIKLFLVAAILTLTAGTTMAQKTAYISVDQAVSIMPEIQKINDDLKKFQTDSLNAELTSLIQEYNYKDSILSKTDTTKIPVAVKKQHRQDLESIAYQVQNWQGISQNYMQAKQEELLAPVYRKVISTIQQVAKENGYAYVYNKEALVVAPPADDLLPLVAKKLNIKLPAEGNAAPGGAPATKK